MGHNAPDFRSEEEKARDEAFEMFNRELETLRFSFIEVSSYTQIIGGQEVVTANTMNAENMEDRIFLALSQKNGFIDAHQFREDGTRRRIYTQNIRYVDKIYYKEKNVS